MTAEPHPDLVALQAQLAAHRDDLDRLTSLLAQHHESGVESTSWSAAGDGVVIHVVLRDGTTFRAEGSDGPAALAVLEAQLPA